MKIKAKQVRKFRFVVDNGLHSITVDQPKEMGGSNKGVTAVEMTVMSLAACTAQMFVLMAGKTKLDYKDVDVTVNAEKDDKNRVKSANIVLEIISDAPEEMVKKTAKMALENCPVGYMFHESDVEMSEEIIINK